MNVFRLQPKHKRIAVTAWDQTARRFFSHLDPLISSAIEVVQVRAVARAWRVNTELCEDLAAIRHCESNQLRGPMLVQGHTRKLGDVRSVIRELIICIVADDPTNSVGRRLHEAKAGGEHETFVFGKIL